MADEEDDDEIDEEFEEEEEEVIDEEKNSVRLFWTIIFQLPIYNLIFISDKTIFFIFALLCIKFILGRRKKT